MLVLSFLKFSLFPFLFPGLAYDTPALGVGPTTQDEYFSAVTNIRHPTVCAINACAECDDCLHFKLILVMKQSAIDRQTETLSGAANFPIT